METEQGKGALSGLITGTDAMRTVLEDEPEKHAPDGEDAEDRHLWRSRESGGRSVTNRSLGMRVSRSKPSLLARLLSDGDEAREGGAQAQPAARAKGLCARERTHRSHRWRFASPTCLSWSALASTAGSPPPPRKGLLSSSHSPSSSSPAAGVPRQRPRQRKPASWATVLQKATGALLPPFSRSQR